MTGTVTKYNNVSTVNNGVPAQVAVYASGAITNTNIGTTNVYTTVAADGYYRVTTWAMVTTAAASGTMTQTLIWTAAENNTATTKNATTGQLTSVNTFFALGVQNIKVKASTTIQTSVTLNAISGTPVYYWYVIVEAL